LIHACMHSCACEFISITHSLTPVRCARRWINCYPFPSSLPSHTPWVLACGCARDSWLPTPDSRLLMSHPCFALHHFDSLYFDSCQIKLGEVRSDRVSSAQTRSSQVRPDQVRSLRCDAISTRQYNATDRQTDSQTWARRFLQSPSLFPTLFYYLHADY
jgi:hypothetical protein